MQYFFQSMGIALNNIRANPLHTFLSTLGIIIGVASLVGILALGDGLEQAGRNQISKTTSVQSFTISSKSRKVVGGVSVSVENRPNISYEQAQLIKEKYRELAVVDYVSIRTLEAVEGDSVFGIYLHGSTENGIQLLPEPEFISGRFFNTKEVQEKSNVMVISEAFASEYGLTAKNALDRVIEIGEEEFQVIGVLKVPLEGPRAVIPISTFTGIVESYPGLTMKVHNVENLPVIKEEMSQWLNENFEEGSDAFDLISDDFWVEQLSQGILLFKLIMGAITGISVLVGGIGVMNVLLISVTERTKEIGVRKATGAKKKDIISQFLAESITISMVGASIGWVFGMMGVLAFVPIVNKIVSVTFTVVVNPISVLIILAVAILIGVSFGTYPAWRASKLNPIDAIRHE